MTNILKRLICLGLALMLAGSTVVIGYANETETAASMTEEQADALEVLRSFGIISDFYDYNTNVDEPVTRADFVSIVARLVNAQNPDGAQTYYYDVPITHYAYNEISALTKMGAINGVGEKRFEPDTPIDSGAAYKILLSLMGYNVRADVDGGYPSGYYKVAKRLNILVNPQISGKMTRGEMLVVVYRAMRTEIFVPTRFYDNDGGDYITSATETLLSINHGIYYGKGDVNAAKMMTVNGRIPDYADEAIIDSTVCKTEIDMSGLLGEEAEMFVTYDKVKEEATILWAKSTGKREILNITEDKLAGFNDSTFQFSYFTDNDRIKTINLERGITVIYNGREVNEKIDEIFELPRYDVKLVKNENGKFMLAIVKSRENVIAATLDSEKNKIYDTYVPGRILDLEEQNYDYLSIVNSSGVEIGFADITKDSVLSAYKSKDGKYLEVVVSVSRDKGSVEMIITEKKFINISVNGVLYKLNNEDIYNSVTKKGVVVPKPGESVELWLDHKGDIAYIKEIEGEYQVGYLVAGSEDSSPFDSTLLMKVFLTDGTFKVYECREGVTIDGEYCKGTDAIKAALTDVITDDIKSQFVLIETDKDGKLRSIDTSEVKEENGEDEANSLSVDVPLQELSYRWSGQLSTKAVLNDESILFSVPLENTKAAADKDFTIKKKSDLTEWQKYTLEVYKLGNRAGFVRWAVMEQLPLASLSFENNPVLVDEMEVILDEEGEAREVANVYQKGKKIVLYSGDDFTFAAAGVEEGMMIQIKRNGKGECVDAKIVYDPQNPAGYMTPATATPFGEGSAITVGYVNDVVGDIIKVGFESGENVSWVTARNNYSVMVYDGEKLSNRAYSGSFADAKTYLVHAGDCSTVVMRSSNGVPEMFVIYK